MVQWVKVCRHGSVRVWFDDQKPNTHIKGILAVVYISDGDFDLVGALGQFVEPFLFLRPVSENVDHKRLPVGSRSGRSLNKPVCFTNFSLYYIFTQVLNGGMTVMSKFTSLPTYT